MAGVRTIEVGSTIPDAGDILDYAIGLIETYGWNHLDAEGNLPPSSDENGYTLHDAIGTACTRLSAHVTGGAGTKDWVIQFDDGRRVALREEATAAVKNHLPVDTTDYQFNDNAKSVDEVMQVLRDARKDVGV